jgi:hypothetical protein
MDLAKHKYFRLPNKHQKGKKAEWTEGFEIDGVIHGVEMDSVSWSFYQQLIIETLIDMLGMDCWNDHARDVSKANYQAEKDDLAKYIAGEWYEEQDSYDTLLYRKNELKRKIDELTAKFTDEIEEIESEMEHKKNQLHYTLLDSLDESAIEKDDQFDQREHFTSDLLLDMLREGWSFTEVACQQHNRRSLLHNNLLLNKLQAFLEQNKASIIDRWVVNV